MCDERKIEEWARKSVTRRQFGVIGAAGMAAACSPRAMAEAEAAGPVGRRVSVSMNEGVMDGYFVATGKARAPGVIFWPDIAGLRPSKIAMANRLAGDGYAVLVMNQYYRETPAPIWQDFAAFAQDGGFAKVRPWRARLTAEAIMEDARSAVAWLDAQAEVDSGRGIGTQGYCMGGPFAVWSAAAAPGRIGAAASFHGGGLVREDSETSPHRLLQEGTGYLIAIARDDDAEAPDHKQVLARRSGEVGAQSVIEVYEGDHGWTVPDSPAYAEAAAERAYADLMTLYSAHL